MSPAYRDFVADLLQVGGNIFSDQVVLLCPAAVDKTDGIAYNTAIW